MEELKDVEELGSTIGVNCNDDAMELFTILNRNGLKNVAGNYFGGATSVERGFAY